MAKTTIAARKPAGAAAGRRLDSSSAQPHQRLKSERMTQPHRCCILATGCGCKKEKGDAGHHNSTVVARPGEDDFGHLGCKVLVCPVMPATPVFCSSTMAATAAAAGGDLCSNDDKLLPCLAVTAGSDFRGACVAAMERSPALQMESSSALQWSARRRFFPALQMESSSALQWRLAGAPFRRCNGELTGGLGAAMQLAGAAMERSPELPSGAAMERSPALPTLCNGAHTGGLGAAMQLPSLQ